MSIQEQKYLLISEENQQKLIRVIKRLIEKRHFSLLKNLLLKLHPHALANIWNVFNEHENTLIINTLDLESSASVLSELDSKEREDVFKNSNTQWISDRLEELESKEVVDILKDLPEHEANSILRKFNLKYAKKIQSLLQYEDETAGGIMGSDFFGVMPDATMGEIVRYFRKQLEEDDLENIHFVYVLDKKNHLLGYIPIRKLITEKSNKLISSVMSKIPQTVTPDIDQEQVAFIFKDYDLITLPVVSKENVLLGVISIDDVVDVLEHEASEDTYMLAGLVKNTDTEETLLETIRNRSPWTLVNFITTSIAASVLHFFQPILQEYIILVLFMPIIAALSNSTGNQMTTIVVRTLAIKKLTSTYLRQFLLKEILFTIVGAIMIGLLLSMMGWYFSEQNILFCVVIMLSIILTMLGATLFGIFAPLFLKFLKLDPAFGASIIVTAFTDMLSFSIFLMLAEALL